jgi:hypothetical protein
MTTLATLLAILVVVSALMLSAASAASGISKDTWKGAWKFEIDRQDQPALNYYDTGGKTIFRIGCRAHFDMRAVYEVVGVAHDDHIAPGGTFSPACGPEVERVVQVDVGKQR